MPVVAGGCACTIGVAAPQLAEGTADSEAACSELLDIVDVADRTKSAQQELYRP